MACNRENDFLSSESDTDPSDQIHVLVVDDDATTLAIVAAFLRLWHYQVMTVNNSHDALQTLRNNRGFFDLVVTDLHMPNMNGFELQKRIAQEFNLPVIMMSADDKKSVISKCLNDGAVYYLVKPIKPNDVQNLWQYALTGHKRNTLAVEEIESPSGAPSSSSSVYPAVVHQQRNENPISRKRNAEGMGCNQLEVTSLARKKHKLFWTSELHGLFVMAVKQIGLDKAVPKKILDVMNVPGLTRENIASHLQKYRLFLKKATQKDSIDESADRILRSSFANGISPDVLQQIRSAHPPSSGEQQIGSAFSSETHEGDVASLNINPSVAQSQLPNQLQASSSAPATLSHFLYSQSSNGLDHQKIQFAPAASNRQLRIGQSNNWNNQANLFLSGYKPPLQTSGTFSVNTARLKGSEKHGIVSNSYDVSTGTNLKHTWPEQTEAYPSLLAGKNTMQSEDNLGIKSYNGVYENANLSIAQNNANVGSVAIANQGTNTNSYLRNNSSGVEISCAGAGQNGNVLSNSSSIINNFELMIEAENGAIFSAATRNDTPPDMFQGGFSSAGATQRSPVPNQLQNTSWLPSQPQQQCGAGNAGGFNDFASNKMAGGDIIIENSREEEIDGDELVKLFFMLDSDDIFIDNEQQGEGSFNPESHPVETGMPDGVENLNSNSSQAEESLNQEQGAAGVTGKNAVETAASISNPSDAMDWGMELLDDLLGDCAKSNRVTSLLQGP